ncbi:MAG: hypothetical protein EBT83_14620 [Betaproteobacteria bacterium]|nr:hypothetical protein [Betaproteobacteria bacterium]
MSDSTESADKATQKIEASAEAGASEPAVENSAHAAAADAAVMADEVAVVKETSFDTVITRVLDASDVANKTASIAADSTGQLIAATAAVSVALVGLLMEESFLNLLIGLE